MIALIIFFLHILAFTYFFAKEFQKEGLSAGMLTAGFNLLIFAVGWSIATFFLKFFIEPEGFGMWLNRDALSLLMLTMGEGLFYFYYYKEDKKS